MADQSSSAAAVDQTPISPVRLANPVRRNSLEQYLQNRPNREELVQSEFTYLTGLLEDRPVLYLWVDQY